MKGTSHVLAGIATGIAIADKIPVNPIITVGLTTFAAVIVDIDEKHSIINKIFPGDSKVKNIVKGAIGLILYLTKIPILKYIGIILALSIICNNIEIRFSLFKGFEKRTYHRTIFHDPTLGIILLVAPLYIMSVPQIYAIPYLVGLSTHYFLDSLTVSGLPLYLNNRVVRMPIHYRSNNMFFEYIFLGCYLGAVYFLGIQ